MQTSTNKALRGATDRQARRVARTLGADATGNRAQTEAAIEAVFQAAADETGYDTTHEGIEAILAQE